MAIKKIISGFGKAFKKNAAGAGKTATGQARRQIPQAAPKSAPTPKPKDEIETLRRQKAFEKRVRAKQEKVGAARTKEIEAERFRRNAAEQGSTPRQHRATIKKDKKRIAANEAAAEKKKAAEEQANSPEAQHQRRLAATRQEAGAKKVEAKRERQITDAEGTTQPEWKKKALIYGGVGVAGTIFVAGAASGATSGAVQGAMAPPDEIYRKRMSAPSPYTAGDIWPNPDRVCAVKERKSFKNPKQFKAEFNPKYYEWEIEVD
jgi:hypothetical protein